MTIKERIEIAIKNNKYDNVYVSVYDTGAEYNPNNVCFALDDWEEFKDYDVLQLELDDEEFEDGEMQYLYLGYDCK